MKNCEFYAHILKLAEQQFSLASAVRLAVTDNKQPLELPTIWSHGKHQVQYEEIALTREEADMSSFYMQRCATYIMATQVHEVIKRNYPNAKTNPQIEIQNCYQISRMIRNAFAHNIFDPVWAIDIDCQNKVFEIPGIITLNTELLDGKRFDWRDYGGPLALLRLSQYVRENILKVHLTPSNVPPQTRKIMQQGNLILKEVSNQKIQELIDKDKIRKVPVKNGEIHLPGGHVIKGNVNLYETITKNRKQNKKGDSLGHPRTIP